MSAGAPGIFWYRLFACERYPKCCTAAPPLQGRLTLLLGPPSSGKSVLLKTLAGQLAPSKSLRVGSASLLCSRAACRDFGSAVLGSHAGAAVLVQRVAYTLVQRLT